MTAILQLATDVDISGQADGDTLIWNATTKKWVSQASDAAATITTLTSTTGNITTINATTVNGTTGNITTVNATTLNGTTVNAGAAGSAGTLSIFPTTTAKGHVNITASDASGNTTTIINVAAQAGNRTYTFPDAKGNGTVSTTSGSNLWIGDIYQCSGNLTKNANITYADIPGLTGLAIALGTYRFDARIAVSTGATPGAKVAFNYTTAVLSAIESTGIGTTNGASPAVVHTTTTTTQTDLFTQAAAVAFIQLHGTFTVSTAGTLAIQGAQNTSNGSNTIFLVGSSLELTRIA